MIGGAHLPHQVRAQRGAVIAHIGAGLELHLASLTQLPHVRTSWRRTTINVKKGPFHRTKGNDAISKALQQISKSPFVRRINKARLPQRLSQPTFTICNGRTDLVEHVSHFNQKMVVHANNEALMCKVFPSSLGLIAMRWFDALEEGSIGSFKELTRAFDTRFITYSRVPRLVDSLLSMAMREGETLKTYSDRY